MIECSFLAFSVCLFSDMCVLSISVLFFHIFSSLFLFAFLCSSFVHILFIFVHVSLLCYPCLHVKNPTDPFPNDSFPNKLLVRESPNRIQGRASITQVMRTPLEPVCHGSPFTVNHSRLTINNSRCLKGKVILETK